MSDSLKKRFSFKLFTNLVGLVSSILVAGIVPRSLGPVVYGNFSFLTSFFTKTLNLFDSGTSSAFYTKLSQQPKRHSLIKFYWSFIGLIALTIVFILLPTSFSNLRQIIWPDQKLLYIWMALLWAFLVFANQILLQMADAHSLTVKSEIIRVIQKIVSVSLIFIMLWLGLFTLLNYFIFYYIILLFLFLGFLLILRKNGISLYPRVKLESSVKSKYIKEFYTYSKPLIRLSIVGFIVGIFDRWILQNYAGSAQQGYYGLSLRIASLCFIFTSAMTPLILREFTIAFKENNFDIIKQKYLKFSSIFLFIASFVGVFTSVQSGKIGILLGGNQYQGAHYAIMIMALYPIHQTLGQMNGSFFLATNNTKLYGNIGMVYQIIGLPFIFFMIAPSSLWGLNLGSLGLALKMVIIQIIGSNFEIWFISKKLKFSYVNILIKQIYILSFLGVFAYGTYLLGNLLFENMILSILFSGITYSIVVGFCVFLFPTSIGSSRIEILDLVKMIVRNQ